MADSSFPFYGNVGKEVDQEYLREWEDLGNFLDALAVPGDSELAERLERTWPRPYATCSVESLGRWHRWEAQLVTLFETGATCRTCGIYALLLRERDGRYHLLTYWGWGRADSVVMKGVFTVSDHPVLTHVLKIDGTGNFREEYYFLLDAAKEVPVRLNLDPIDTTLKKILPEDHGVWKGGGFDIENLCFRHYVWRRGDGNCCPTGGAVCIKFELRDNALVPVRYTYDARFTVEEGLGDFENDL